MYGDGERCGGEGTKPKGRPNTHGRLGGTAAVVEACLEEPWNAGGTLWWTPPHQPRGTVAITGAYLPITSWYYS